MEGISNLLLEMVKNYCVGEIDEDTDLYERGLNSLNSIEFLVDIEDEFDITFEEDELQIQNVKTIKSFVEVINAKIKEQNIG